MSNYILVGCDLHDETMLLKIARNREDPETKTFGTDRDSRQVMIKYLQQKATRAGRAKIVFAYEASACGYGLYDDLTDAGIECHVLAPSCMSPSVKARKMKTDEKDAQRILDALRSHVLAGTKLPEVWVPDPQTRDDREVVRTRLDVGGKARTVKAQVQCLLKRHSVRKPKHVQGRWSLAYRNWLESLTRDGSVLGPGGAQALASYLRQLWYLEQEKKVLDEKVAELARTNRYRKAVRELTKIEGVGMLTSMVFLTEMGDLSRFHNRRQVAAYLGVVPRTYETGDDSDHKGHITHQGPGRVRAVLCQSVWVLLRYDGKEAAVYKRLVRKNPKHKKIAVVACMRRLAIRMWRVGRKALESDVTEHKQASSVCGGGADCARPGPIGSSRRAAGGTAREKTRVGPEGKKSPLSRPPSRGEALPSLRACGRTRNEP